jgi:hypothetical protein
MMHQTSQFSQQSAYWKRAMLHIQKNFSKIWFPNDVSQSHVIYYFEKCVTISWDCETSFGNQILEENFGKFSISHWKIASKMVLSTFSLSFSNKVAC